MSTRSCPDWPMLLEIAPDLHFKHYSVAEAELPAEVLVNIPEVPREAIAICADLEHNVFNPTHTDPRIAAALQDTHWYDLNEWARSGPRT
ncbi:MAG: hypothetical protein WD027_01130 [Gaiellales bacterium]